MTEMRMLTLDSTVAVDEPKKRSQTTNERHRHRKNPCRPLLLSYSQTKDNTVDWHTYRVPT